MLDQDSKPPARIKKAIWRANLASYAFLVLFPIVGLIIGVYHT